ncbi:MAG: hypothetical protein K2K91_08265 [Ruminococcus sp.]|nr:hypothetical protein [Ruminococcus sp.]
MKLQFYDEEHEELFYKILKKMKRQDCYHLSMAYLISLDNVCREHINDIFDFEENCIKPDTVLNHGWQTSTSQKTTRLAYNLWNGYCTDGETYTDKNGYQSFLTSNNYAVDNIFCCSYAPYYWQAIQLRYSEYTT